MPQSSLSVLMNGYLAPGQVALGRLVLDMKNPGQNFCPFGALHLQEGDISKAEFSDLKSLANAESSSRFKSALSKVFTIFAEKSQATIDGIFTKTAMRHQLLNVNLKFESIFEDNNVKKWIEKVVLTGAEVYMVVGLHTLEDASISLNRDASTEISGHIQAPITDPVAPGASKLPGIGTALDVKLESEHKSRTSLGASFVTPGERIIAVQYQKVAITIFSSKGSKNLVEAKLKMKTVWRSFGTARGETDLDTFEAVLEEVTTADDIGEDVEFEAASVEGKVFVILD
ncbi:hypothetical protein B0O99DRAFT_695463 [Bisporella sp. PMI_857]|nr:hypothetical protein B0O99DRAFT_695463 [Bisporella sp. PMI_857]